MTDRRRQLWRDSTTILIGVVLALLAGQLLIPGNGVIPAASPSPEPSEVAIGSSVPQLSLGPGETFGPNIDPSLGIDATPTPIPVITLGPSPSPSPTPKPTVKPTPKPTVKPTAKPTVRPSAGPTGTPAPPAASFTWSPSQPAPLVAVTFNSSGTTGATSYAWTFGDGGTSTAANPSHTYAVPGTYTVRLTATGPGGSTFVEHQVTVAIKPT
jgi:PKD domain